MCKDSIPLEGLHCLYSYIYTGLDGYQAHRIAAFLIEREGNLLSVIFFITFLVRAAIVEFELLLCNGFFLHFLFFFFFCTGSRVIPNEDPFEDNTTFNLRNLTFITYWLRSHPTLGFF